MKFGKKIHNYPKTFWSLKKFKNAIYSPPATPKPQRAGIFSKFVANPVTYERFYNLKLECDYGLQFYPFDTQKCLIKMQPRRDLLNVIILNPQKFWYKGPKLLMTYEVKSVKMIQSEGRRGLEV